MLLSLGRCWRYIYLSSVTPQNSLAVVFVYCIISYVFCFLLYTILYNFPFRKIHVVSAKSGRNHTNLRKVVDFGLACQFTPGEVMRQCAGTVVYVAPQAPGRRSKVRNITETWDGWYRSSRLVVATQIFIKFSPRTLGKMNKF